MSASTIVRQELLKIYYNNPYAGYLGVEKIVALL